MAHGSIPGGFPPRLNVNFHFCVLSLSVGCRYWFVLSASRHLGGGRPFSRASSRVGSFMRQELCTKCYLSNVLQFNFCWHCGTPPYRGPPVPRDPRVPPVQIDLAKLRARRDAVLAGMAEQPGQQRKCKVADDFDAFLRAYSAGLCGWESGTCLLYTSPSPRDQRGSRMPSSA